MSQEQLQLPLDGEGAPDNEHEDANQQPEEPLNEYGYTEAEWNAPVFDGFGPTRREVEEWKEKHPKGVYFTPFDGEVYIWRVLEREEYKGFINNRELTTMDREEEMTVKCVLYPRNLTREKLRTDKAGVPSLLSEMIMDKSGFVAQSAPIKL
ncbi:hypothetical protein SAMN02799624_05437 [Paenibacillus sp. UNC496MF]|uniref:hypothetical protein n=1 Tax=Paenibacillus sp. UNC496MF TaxID=1502753 RepID=UPI0008E072D2|nr:hypothetical protein [Paenibacillus sp. UNC496MF]SFJ66159.1 hypothetical protein SAMN02799624_05437 [Paenibacillus sp. UNC496MF]